MLRGLYDLLFVDSAVEGRFMDYVAARVEGVVLRGRFAKFRTRTHGKMVIKNRVAVFEIDFSNDTLAKVHPCYELPLQSWIPTMDKTFIDVGANVGFYSLLAVHHRSFKRAIAFEPNPATFATLSNNVKHNSLQGVVIAENSALGDALDTLMLMPEKEHTGASRVVTRKRAMTDALVSVPQTTFDRYAVENRIDPSEIGYFKIDVEGFEYRTLQGSIETLKHTRPGTRVQVEVWHISKHRQDVFRLLQEAGFVERDNYLHDYLFEKA